MACGTAGHEQLRVTHGTALVTHYVMVEETVAFWKRVTSKVFGRYKPKSNDIVHCLSLTEQVVHCNSLFSLYVQQSAGDQGSQGH